MPPGESSFLVNNSMYTNSMANVSLMLPHQLVTEHGIPFSDKFKAYADSLFIPFDENLQFNPAFDTYQPGRHNLYNVMVYIWLTLKYCYVHVGIYM